MKLLHDFQGLAIRLTDERRAHILGHPEMASMESAIEGTLLQAERVVQSATRKRGCTIASTFAPWWAASTCVSSSRNSGPTPSC